MKSNVYIELFIRILKCFFILLVFGEFLPKIIDYGLYIYIKKFSVYHNSILVYNISVGNRSILFNYMYIFNEFLKW